MSARSCRPSKQPLSAPTPFSQEGKRRFFWAGLFSTSFVAPNVGYLNAFIGRVNAESNPQWELKMNAQIVRPRFTQLQWINGELLIDSVSRSRYRFTIGAKRLCPNLGELVQSVLNPFNAVAHNLSK
jgi:hypothetical protein